MVTYSPEPGVMLEDVEERALKAEKLILDQPGVETMQYSIGKQSAWYGISEFRIVLYYV